jgi:hypothetical protein
VDVVNGTLPPLFEDDLKSYARMINMMERCTTKDPTQRSTVSQLVSELS